MASSFQQMDPLTPDCSFDVFDSLDAEQLVESYASLFCDEEEVLRDLSSLTSSRVVPFLPCELFSGLSDTLLEEKSHCQVPPQPSPPSLSMVDLLGAPLNSPISSCGSYCESTSQTIEPDHQYSSTTPLTCGDDASSKSSNSSHSSSHINSNSSANCNSSDSSSSSSSSSSVTSTSLTITSKVSSSSSSGAAVNRKANRRKRQVTEPKSFPCKFEGCSDVFLKSSHLKVHIRKHTGEKPFRCTHNGCKWSFRRSDELSRHKRCHSGVKPYVCLYCSKCFGRSDHLSKHMKVHEKSLTHHLTDGK